jgi:hypothetical protein
LDSTILNIIIIYSYNVLAVGQAVLLSAKSRKPYKSGGKKTLPAALSSTRLASLPLHPPRLVAGS